MVYTRTSKSSIARTIRAHDRGMAPTRLTGRREL